MNIPQWIEEGIKILVFDSPAIFVHLLVVIISLTYRKQLRRVALCVIIASFIFIFASAASAFFNGWLQYSRFTAQTITSDDFFFYRRASLWALYAAGLIAHILLIYAVFSNRNQSRENNLKNL